MTHSLSDLSGMLAATGSFSSRAAATADTSRPTVVRDPDDGGPVDGALRITFSETVRFGSGTLMLRTFGGIVHTEVLGSSPYVTLSGDTLVYKPPQPLLYATSYFITFSEGAILDLAGNAFMHYDTAASFSTGLSPVAVRFDGTDGEDTVDGSNLADVLKGGGNPDTLRGWGGDDYLDGGDEAVNSIYGDKLFGGDGNDTMLGGSGNDSLEAGSGNDKLDGGDGEDFLYGEAGDDTLDGGAGNDVVSDSSGVNTLLGGAGDDVLRLLNGATGLVDGGDGNDSMLIGVGTFGEITTVNGGAGADHIGIALGGAYGQVKAAGGAGIDTFAVYRSDPTPGVSARLIITDFATGSGGDLIDLAGLLPASHSGNPFDSALARLRVSDGDTLLQVRLSDNGDDYQTFIEIKGVLPAQLNGSSFVGGYVPLGATVGVTLRGTEDDDRLYGRELDDILYGLGGNDFMDGGAGDDTLDGGAGNDIVVDTSGNNRLLGGTGNDHITATSTGLNLLDGGDGDDTLSAGNGNATLLGGAGKDLLHLGWPDGLGPRTIVMDGGDGDDEFQFNSRHDPAGPVTISASGGSGADTFWVNEAAPGLTITDFGGDDRIGLGGIQAGRPPGNPFGALGYLSIRQDGGNTAIYVDRDGAAGNAHGFTLALTLAGVAPSALAAHHFVGRDNPDGSSNGLVLIGGAGPDSLTGTPQDDTISGGAGRDTLVGLDGNDTIRGGDEADEVRDSGDSILGGEGDDTIDGGAGGDYVSGEAGDDLLHGDGGMDRLDGGAGADLLYGDAGNDQLEGGSGDDKLYGGDGDDGIEDHSGANLIDGGAGDDLIHTGRPGSGGTVVDSGAGNDTLEIDLAAERVDSGTGDDRITLRFDPYYRIETAMRVDAGAGNDTVAIIGDTRPVTVAGGAGSDHYSFGNRMPALVTITDFQPGAGGDVFDLYSLLPHAVQGNPLAPGGGMRLVQDGSRVLLQHDADGAAGAQAFATRIVFEGAVLALFSGANFTEGMRPDGSSAGLVLHGTDARDELLGTRLDDTLHGGDGNDVIQGKFGNDTLYGDAGIDYLQGEAGDDILVGGSGNDELIGGWGDDVLSGGTGIDTVQTSGQRSDFTLTRTADGYRLADRRPGAPDGTDILTGVERIAFTAYNRVALDVDGGAGQAYRLYRAAFDRTPDEAGIGFWIAAIDRGTALVDIAAGFAASKEFRDMYGTTPSNADLVARLYQNILHRPAEKGGFDYWLKALDDKLVSLPEVLTLFSESPENQQAVAGLIADGIAYEWYW